MPLDRKVSYYRDLNDPNDYKGDDMSQYYGPSDDEEDVFGHGNREGVRPGASQAKRWSSGGMAYDNGPWANPAASPTLTRNAVDRGRERETGNHNAASRTRGFGESWEQGSSLAFAENTPAFNFGSRYGYAPELPNRATRASSPEQVELNSIFRRLYLPSQNAGQSFSSAAPSAAPYAGHGHDQGSVYRPSRITSGNPLAAGERQYNQGPLVDNGFQSAGNAFTRRLGNTGGYPTGQFPGFSLPQTLPAPRGSGHVPAVNRRRQESSQPPATQQALSGSSQYYAHLAPLNIQVPAVSGVPLPAAEVSNAYRIAQEQCLDPALRDYLRLEKSRSSHEKARAEAYRIADISGHVVMFCVENSGSRLVQALIKDGNCDVREQVLREVHSNLLQLSKDPYGNYVIQKLLEHGTQSQKIIIWNALKGNVASLSCNKHACRVVQDVLKHVLVTQQVEIVEEMKPALEDLIRDQYGNHLVQVALEVVARPHVDFIYERFRGRVCQLAQDVHCCRILQTMLIKGEMDDRASIMAELSARFEDLCIHQYGNYVLQKAIKYALPADRDRLVAVLMRDPFHLAQNKAGSHVLETIIKEGTLEERKAILANLTVVEPNGVRRLETLLIHEFGNYVCKTLLKNLRKYDRQEFDSLWQDVHPFLLQTRHNSPNKTVKTIDEILKSVLENDYDMVTLTSTASRPRDDVGGSPAQTPQLTMEPNSPTSNPPSTRDGVDEPVNGTLLPGADKALHPAKVDWADVKIRLD